MLEASDIKKIIDFNENCYFSYYKNNMLYYSFFFDGQECLFPIETNLLERNNQLNISERTITLMSYIRKAIRHKTIIQKNIE